jgi:hypothetical protein
VLRTPGPGRWEDSRGDFDFSVLVLATIRAVTGLLLVVDARTGALDRACHVGAALRSFMTSIRIAKDCVEARPSGDPEQISPGEPQNQVATLTGLHDDCW